VIAFVVCRRSGQLLGIDQLEGRSPVALIKSYRVHLFLAPEKAEQPLIVIMCPSFENVFRSPAKNLTIQMHGPWRRLERLYPDALQRQIGVASMILCLSTIVAIGYYMAKADTAGNGIIAMDNFRWSADIVFLVATIGTIALSLDYNEFVITGKLTSLEMREPKPCR